MPPAGDESTVVEGDDEAGVTTPGSPPTITLTGKRKVSSNQLIPISPDCFDVAGSENPKKAGSNAKGKAVKLIIDSIINNNLTPQQQVLALREALLNFHVRIVAKSAGVIDNSLFDVYEHIINNMSKVISRATKTTSLNGRTNDDKRSLVESVVTSTMEPRGAQERGKSNPTKVALAKVLGINCQTYRRIVNKVQCKCDALEIGDESTVYSQVIKRKSWTKISEELKQNVYNYIRNEHPHVVRSPLANDMVTVKDPEDCTKFIKVPKLLLQVSIRELHTDVIENVEGATDPAGNPVISDTKLREILSPEVKRMTDRYKQMCACQLCVLIGYYHSALKKY